MPAGGGGGDMMSEMAKRLRDRKAKAEMNAQSNVGDPQCCILPSCSGGDGEKIQYSSVCAN